MPRSLRPPFVAILLGAMVLGAAVGSIKGAGYLPWLGTESLGEVGKVIIGLIKSLAGPLLFLAVIDAFLRTRIQARAGLIMVGIALTNGLIALAIGLAISNIARPGDRLRSLLGSASAAPKLSDKSIDFVKEITAYLPTSIVQPFLDNSVITIVILAVLAGLGLRRAKDEQQARGERDYEVIEGVVATLLRAVEVVLKWVVGLVPLAVFAVVARTVAKEGFRPLEGLAIYVLVVLAGLAIHILVVYQGWLIFVAKRPLAWFWRGGRKAIITALGTSSSLASLPKTLECLDEMDISPASPRLAACVGTNLNNDGILLYEAMAVLMVAQIHGMDLSFSQQLLAAASCALAGVGIGGIPDAGLISLALVLGTVGLPVEVLPLLLTVDWVLSRARAVTNVISDLLVAVLLDKFEPKIAKVVGDNPLN